MANLDALPDLPPRPSAAGVELRCLGHFWRIKPEHRPFIVEFWSPPHRDLNGRPVPGAWQAGLFDGATSDEALAVFAYHFLLRRYSISLLEGIGAGVGSYASARMPRAASWSIVLAASR